MTAILILLPVALILGGVFAGLFLYAARSGQFDDLDDPPERMLHDYGDTVAASGEDGVSSVQIFHSSAAQKSKLAHAKIGPISLGKAIATTMPRN